MNNILRYDDILKISSFFEENGIDNPNIEIVNLIDNKKELNRINDDFFFRLKAKEDIAVDDVSNEDSPILSDEVVIEIGNIKFIYRLKEDDI